MTVPTAPAALRALGLACVLALVAMGRDPFGGGRGPASEIARGPGDGPGAGWAGALASLSPPSLVLRADAPAPDARELAALAALAARAPLAVELPPAAPRAPTLAPTGPMAAGRRAALAVTVAGPAGSSVPVRVEGDAGAVDTLDIAVDSSGAGTASVAVRPAAAGWRGWTLRAGEEEAAAGAWVEDAAPVRVVLLGGAGGWEARYSARALEEAGASVSVRLPLGRGLRVEGTGARADSADVFVILPGAALSDADAEAIAARVRGDGAGVLIAGTGEPSLARALGLPARARRAPAGAIEWSLPADLEPLPARPGLTTLAADAPPGASAAARVSLGAVLLLRPAGRGRAAWTGLAETWRWRLEAGAGDAHRAYWSALVDWLAAGRLAGARHAFAPSPPLIGEVAHAVVPRGSSALLRTPSGALEPPGPFVAADTGLHALVDGAGDVLVGTRPVPASRAHASHAFGHAALLAYESGGTALPRAPLAAWLAERGAPARRTVLLPWLLLAAATASFLGAWTMRRFRGDP